MARMGFLDKAKELDAMLEAKRVRLKKVRAQRDISHGFGRHILRLEMIFRFFPPPILWSQSTVVV